MNIEDNPSISLHKFICSFKQITTVIMINKRKWNNMHLIFTLDALHPVCLVVNNN